MPKRKRLKPRIDTKKRQEMFLQAYANTGTVYHACRMSGVSRCTMYYWRNNDKDFAYAMQVAIDCNTEQLEQACFQKAMKGDSLLMMFLLKARKPEVYREKYEVKIDVEEVNAEIERRLARVAGRVQGSAPPALTFIGGSNNEGASAPATENVSRS